jgi:ketosteroid isomerase-like protein
MSEENVEVVRRLFETYNQGDFDAALACLARDVVYETGQELPARGPDEVRAMWERWESDWEAIATETEEFIDAGDRVLVTVRYSGRGSGSGIDLDDRLFDVYTLRDGKVVHKAEFRERAVALAAAGLPGRLPS